ncbi:MAG: Cation-transporting P-type ATPase [Actinomycetota bacterium]|jgi:Cu+-exporting ATPase
MTAPEALKTLDLDIEGMTCTACARRIEKNLNKVEGVSAFVDFASERAHVTVASNVTRDQLVAVVVDAGYGVGSNRDELTSLAWRLWVGGALSLPLVLVGMVPAFMGALTALNWSLSWPMIAGLLALPVAAWVAWPFHSAAFKNLRQLTSTMDTLVSLGVLVAYIYSAWQLAIGGMESYFEVSAVVPTVVLFGRWLEVRTRRSATDSVRALLAAVPETAVVRRDGTQMTLPTAQVQLGDIVVVATGAKIPVDGVVHEGFGQLDNALITGESVPEEVLPGSQVAAGALNVGPSLVISATAISANSRISQIADLVREATAHKAKITSLTDRISVVFVPTVIAIAIVTFAVRALIGLGTDSALSAAIAVLVIACPCALGIAVPMSLAVATAVGAKRGIVIRDPDSLSLLSKVTQVVLDKTGTLTTGHLSVTSLHPLAGFHQPTAVALAAAVERSSTHPIAKAIAELDSTLMAEGVVEVAGKGVSGNITHFALGPNPTQVEVSRRAAETFSNAEELTAAISAAGPKSLAIVAIANQAILLIALDDALRPEAQAAIAQLHAIGVEPVLLSGDVQARVTDVAGQLSIAKFHAGVTPERKLAVIHEIKNSANGGLTAMVGDGLNDVAALAAADVGLAMGSGTHAAQSAAAITIVDDDPLCIPFALKLGRRTWRNIVQNLVWAFGYNIVLIPVAALGLLNPMLAGTAMAFSSISVVLNAIRLRY